MDRSDSNLTVLLIDDDDVDRMAVVRHLRESFCVIQASTGVDGEELFRTFDPACVLLDFRLPDVDGLELLRQFVSEGVPVIMLTGKGSESTAVDALKAGADDYLVKSQLNEIRLSRAVRNAVEKSSLREEVKTRFAEFEELIAAAETRLRDPLFEIARYSMSVYECIDAGDPERARSDAKSLQSTATSLVEFLSRLLDYARTASGEIHWQRVDLKHVVDSVSTSLAASHPGDVQFRVGKLPMVDGDEVLLKKLFKNLFENSIHFRRPGQPVRIEVGSALKRNQWLLFASDNGVGLGEVDSEKLFNPMCTAGNEPDSGFGLGLAICAKIVRRHHGRIWIAPNENQGIRVQITLPVIDYQRVPLGFRR